MLLKHMIVCGDVVCFWRDSPQWARASSFTKFLDHTQQSITVGRTPLDEWSTRRRDLYLLTNTQQTNIHARGGVEPPISAGERLHTYSIDRAATGTGVWSFGSKNYYMDWNTCSLFKLRENESRKCFCKRDTRVSGCQPVRKCWRTRNRISCERIPVH